MPGYFHLVPPGQDTLFYCRIFLKLTLVGLRPLSVNLRFRSEFSTPKGQEDARGFNLVLTPGKVSPKDRPEKGARLSWIGLTLIAH